MRGHHRAPHRRDLQPASLGPILSNTFLLEERGDARVVYRLAGSGIFEIFQRELRGLDWLTLFEEESRPLAQDTAASALSRAETSLLHADGRTARHRTVPVEILILPLARDPDAPARAVGSLVTCDRPYWLGAQPLIELTALHAETSRAPGDPGAPAPESSSRSVLDMLDAGPIRRLRHLALYLGGREAGDTDH
ncbi:hypothetical protein N177_2029 [Lutibaculum baratangense AMV1]|uniref:PAS domain-containing protein n=1 Tax=Lutibaculum baratangense AMV1 TaxID=631454 RepID=V4RPN1_9HYPH|nr:hypothetical protein N177_2029 [Lutibaculum baratangense AMV1]